MDGIHDLGGKEGFGPVDVNEPEVSFHYPWEGRMWAIAKLTGAPDWTIDWWRHVRELIEPTDYLTRRYFDQWMQTQTAALIDSGILTLDELTSGGARSAPSLGGSPMQHSDVIARVAARAKDYSRQIDARPAFAEGDNVRARLMGARGHTRLPAYVRGRVGVIRAHHGAHVLADASARGEKRAEHLYSVAFRADALWPEVTGCADKVFLDLWESYLERP
jgi:nitrile hydratase beta subunit